MTANVYSAIQSADVRTSVQTANVLTSTHSAKEFGEQLIMETVSKKKKGRPPVVSEGVRFMENAVGIGDSCKTQRGKQNHLYMIAAMGVLNYEPEFLWLGLNKVGIMADTVHLRHTILQELGRLRDDPEAMRAIARRICELKPDTVTARRIIRQFRTGRKPTVSAECLSSILNSTLDNYAAARPSVTFAMMRTALLKTLAIVESLIPQEEDE